MKILNETIIFVGIIINYFFIERTYQKIDECNDSMKLRDLNKNLIFHILIIFILIIYMIILTFKK